MKTTMKKLAITLLCLAPIASFAADKITLTVANKTNQGVTSGYTVRVQEGYVVGSDNLVAPGETYSTEQQMGVIQNLKLQYQLKDGSFADIPNCDTEGKFTDSVKVVVKTKLGDEIKGEEVPYCRVHIADQDSE